jgi:hypothetical protein
MRAAAAVIGSMLIITSWLDARADQLSGTCAGVTGQVLEYGLARGELEREVKDPSNTTPAGVFWHMKNVRLVQRTERVPLADGNMMYLSYELSGLPAGRTLEGFKIVKTFPAMTSPEGRTFARAESSFSVTSPTGTARETTYWTFDAARYAFEMVPGEWTFRLFHEDCLIFEKLFEAYKP